MKKFDFVKNFTAVGVLIAVVAFSLAAQAASGLVSSQRTVAFGSGGYAILMPDYIGQSYHTGGHTYAANETNSFAGMDLSDPTVKILMDNDSYDWSPNTKMLLINLEGNTVVTPKNSQVAFQTMRWRWLIACEPSLNT